MVRKTKEKEIKQRVLKVKDVIKELKLSDDEIVYIHKHNVAGDTKYNVSDIENNILNKKVMIINQHYDSRMQGSDGVRIIIE